MNVGLVLLLAAGTWAFRGIAPQVGRMPAWLDARLGGLAPALLAALVLSQVTSRSLVPSLDARFAGVAVAGGLALVRAPFVACIAAGAATAAGLRAAGVA